MSLRSGVLFHKHGCCWSHCAGVLIPCAPLTFVLSFYDSCGLSLDFGPKADT